MNDLEAALNLYRDQTFVLLEVSPELSVIVGAAERWSKQQPDNSGRYRFELVNRLAGLVGFGEGIDPFVVAVAVLDALNGETE